jgi:xanthine/CO dehydrogenase XdhC/CoxF family maturation factor
MAEIQQILNLWRRHKETGEPAVLATVVKTAGSSYRLPGARLLIGSQGQKAGSVSGGCLEEDLLKKAWWLTERGSVVRRYDTTAEGRIGSEGETGGFGLGCNGIIHVLLERISPVQTGPLDWIDQVHAMRRPAAVCHVLGVDPPGTRLVVHPDGTESHNLTDPGLRAAARELADEAIASGRSHHATVAGSEVFAETLTPPIRLLIFGAGDDAIPLARLGAFLGWRIHVLDSRSHYARPEKFPDAEQVSVRPMGAALPVTVDPWTVAVLMTHSYSQDLDALRALAPHPPRYVGVLGPRKRTDTLLADADLDRSAFRDALYGPTGLDLGADGAHQVALAAIAEIQAVLNQRNGGHLRDARTAIHAASGEPFVGSIVCA